MPSETAIVTNSRGNPPASRTPCLARLASRSSDRLQGVTSFHDEATPTWGLSQSASVMPTARSMARAGRPFGAVGDFVAARFEVAGHMDTLGYRRGWAPGPAGRPIWAKWAGAAAVALGVLAGLTGCSLVASQHLVGRQHRGQDLLGTGPHVQGPPARGQLPGLGPGRRRHPFHMHRHPRGPILAASSGR